MTNRPHLVALADRLGILGHYVDVNGERHQTADETRQALALAMGFDGSSEEAAAESLGRLETHDRDTVISPTAVAPVDSVAATHLDVRSTGGERADYYISIRAEDGPAQSMEGSLPPEPPSRLPLPNLPAGYYDIDFRVESGVGVRSYVQRRIIHPTTCYEVSRALGDRRGYGVNVNLYAVRTEANWGVGDLGDLGTIAEWCGEMGACFVGINPLHAHRNAFPEISPYLPLSRVYRNPIYLEVAAIPELAECANAKRLLSSDPFQRERERLRSLDAVDYDGVWALKREAVELLHRHFEASHAGGATERRQAFERYCRRHDPSLGAAAEYLAGALGGSAALHRFLQFELDRQLSDAARRAKAAGLTIGLYADLAIGTALDGADTTFAHDLFVRGASLGAPPDDYAQEGQDWSMPPMHPLRLHESGYGHWRAILAAGMCHAGALRIDHVMGLERQFWIPAGMSAAQGAYVRFPLREMLGVLALESHRNGTVVIGESLGTLPDGFLETLHHGGVLSSQVLYFEREHDGAYRPSQSYSRHALVTATTHDLPTISEFWTGRDLDLRERAGLLPDEERDVAQRARVEDREALSQRLHAERIVEGGALSSPAAVVRAVHRLVGATPAPLVGVAFDDLAGEQTCVNIPGAPPTRYRAWSRKNTRTLTEVKKSDTSQQLVQDMARLGRRTQTDAADSS
jgi:4-alpha-glucanotransferase